MNMEKVEKKNRKSKKAREIEMKGEVKKWLESGLSKNRYCLENGHKKTTFSYWVDKFKRKETKDVEPKTSQPLIKTPFKLKNGVLENNLRENSCLKPEPIKLHFGNFTLEISNNFSERSLKNILKILQEN